MTQRIAPPRGGVGWSDRAAGPGRPRVGRRAAVLLVIGGVALAVAVPLGRQVLDILTGDPGCTTSQVGSTWAARVPAAAQLGTDRGLRTAVTVLDTRTGSCASGGAARDELATASVVEVMVAAELLRTGQMRAMAPTAADGTDQEFGLPVAVRGAAVKQGWARGSADRVDATTDSSTGLVGGDRYVVVVLTEGDGNADRADGRGFEAAQAATMTDVVAALHLGDLG